MGFKHTPKLFIELAKEFKACSDTHIVIIAKGEAAQKLTQRIREQFIENMVVLPYQSVNEFPQMLGTGDVLLSVLSEDAGSFSVPSKVLSYLFAKRALLISIPLQNLAARIVSESHAGLLCASGEKQSWLNNANEL